MLKNRLQTVYRLFKTVFQDPVSWLRLTFFFQLKFSGGVENATAEMIRIYPAQACQFSVENIKWERMTHNTFIHH